MYRPMTVTAPEGCLLNPRFPAAVVSRAVTGHYVPLLVFGALHRVIPDRVMAGVGSPLWGITQSGMRDDGRPYTNVLFFNGGMGATARKDGEHVLSWPSNISSTPVEVAERNSPLFVHDKRMRPGSGGAGKFRGGLGQDILHRERVAAADRDELHGRAHDVRGPRLRGRRTTAASATSGSTASAIDNRKQYVLKQGRPRARPHPGRRRLRPREARATRSSPRATASAATSPGGRVGGRRDFRRAIADSPYVHSVAHDIFAQARRRECPRLAALAAAAEPCVRRQNMSTPAKLMFFCGKMAAGKSTLARDLAERENAVLLVQDDFLDSLYPGEISDIPAFVRCSSRLKNALAPHVCALLSKGISVVLDFPANTTLQRAWFRGIFERANVEHELHFVDASDALCKSQLKDRSKNLPPGAPWTTDAEFDAITVYFRPPSEDEGFNVVRHERT